MAKPASLCTFPSRRSQANNELLAKLDDSRMKQFLFPKRREKTLSLRHIKQSGLQDEMRMGRIGLRRRCR